MKLNLIFILLDVLTVLAYPIVLVHGKLRQTSRFMASMDPPNLSETVPVRLGS